MMEKLGEPQTHIGLKAMIKEVDEDNDGQISFREVSCSVEAVPKLVRTYRCMYVRKSMVRSILFVFRGQCNSRHLLYRSSGVHQKWH